jgi:dTDP-4-amino-4,6-dideoxygalactose transaminase
LLGALSFNGNKIVTTGGGGAILTSDERLAVRAKSGVAGNWGFLRSEELSEV